MSYEYARIITTKDIDKQLSETSEFPVQNKVVTAAINNIASIADALPSASATSPFMVCVKGVGSYVLYCDAEGNFSYKKLLTE